MDWLLLSAKGAAVGRLYIVMCGNALCRVTSDAAPRRGERIAHSWSTETPSADLQHAHRVLRAWHVAGDQYTMGWEETLATLRQRVKSINADVRRQEVERAQRGQYVVAIFLFVVQIAAVPVILIAAIHLGALSGFLSAGVFALLLRALKH